MKRDSETNGGLERIIASSESKQGIALRYELVDRSKINSNVIRKLPNSVIANYESPPASLLLDADIRRPSQVNRVSRPFRPSINNCLSLEARYNPRQYRYVTEYNLASQHYQKLLSKK